MQLTGRKTRSSIIFTFIVDHRMRTARLVFDCRLDRSFRGSDLVIATRHVHFVRTRCVLVDRLRSLGTGIFVRFDHDGCNDFFSLGAGGLCRCFDNGTTLRFFFTTTLLTDAVPAAEIETDLTRPLLTSVR